MGGYGASRIGMKHPEPLRRSLHHEPVLYVFDGRGWPRLRRSDQGAGDRQRRRFFQQQRLQRTWRHSRRLRLRTICNGSGVGSRSQEPSALLGSAYQRRRSPAGDHDNANSPLAFVDQYIGNLKQYRAIAMDVGDQDGLRINAASSTPSSITMGSRIHLKSIPARMSAQSPTTSRTMCCRSSARISASQRFHVDRSRVTWDSGGSRA